MPVFEVNEHAVVKYDFFKLTEAGMNAVQRCKTTGKTNKILGVNISELCDLKKRQNIL